MAEDTQVQEAPAADAKPTGAFLDSLIRNNKKIREDRAQAIAEDAQLIYKRKIEDLEVSIKRLNRQRENMLDLSPDNAMNLKVAADFDPDAFVATDLDLGVKIRNKTIELDIAKAQYLRLFGEAI